MAVSDVLSAPSPTSVTRGVDATNWPPLVTAVAAVAPAAWPGSPDGPGTCPLGTAAARDRAAGGGRVHDP